MIKAFILLIIALSSSSRLDTVLFAPWTSSTQSPLMEAGEYMASLGSEEMTLYIQSVAENWDYLKSDSEKINWIQEYCTNKYDVGFCQILSLSLYSREYLPTIQMFQNLATPFLGLCKLSESFLVSKSGYICNPTDLNSFTPFPKSFPLNLSELVDLLSIQSFDHLLNGCDINKSNSFILFTSYQSDLTSWLSSLTTSCVSSLASVYIRPYHSLSTSPVNRTRLGGYGIALDIKNTEYKVLDDRTTSFSQILENGAVETELETDVEGFFFSTLKSRFPLLSDKLAAFKTSLMESASATAESITPLQMKDIGLKTVQCVTRSRDPLKQMVEIIDNFPAMAASVARIPVSDEMSEEAMRLMGEYQNACGTVLINGERVDFDNNRFNVFTLLQKVRASAGLRKDMSEIGLDGDGMQKMREVLRSVLSNDDDTVRLSLEVQQSSDIMFINDVEKDRRYRSLSPNVNNFFMAAFSLPRVRANYLNRVFILDPLQKQSNTYQMCYELLQQGFPIRIGFVLTSEDSRMWFDAHCKSGDDSEVDPLSPITSVQIMQLFYDLYKKGSGILAAVFMNNVVGSTGMSVKEVAALFDAMTESDDAMDILSSHRYLKELCSMDHFVKTTGLRDGMEMMNGRVGLVMGLREFVTAAFQDIAIITAGIESGDVKKISDVLPHLTAVRGSVPSYDPHLYQPFTKQLFKTIPHGISTSSDAARLQDGSLGVLVASLPTVHPEQVVAALTASLSHLSGFTVVVTSPQASHLPLLKVIKRMVSLGAVDSVCEVMTCVKDNITVEMVQKCMGLYLDEDTETIGTDWLNDNSLELWNSKIQSYFGKDEENVQISVNGRMVRINSVTDSIVIALISIDRRMSTPLHDTIPQIPADVLLPFVHSHIAHFVEEIPSLPSASPFLLQHIVADSMIDVTAILDPLSEVAQRVASLLFELQAMLPVSYSVLLVPKNDYSALPLKRFYRYVLRHDHIALYQSLPQQYVYTMSVEVPFRWNVVAFYAEADLDNIRIIDDSTYILAQYVVDSVVVEGSCFLGDDPASGVMLQMSRFGSDAVLSDTVVMNNRGYFQLRADMGLFSLSVSEESSDKTLLSGGVSIKRMNIYLFNNCDDEIMLHLGEKVEIEERKEDPSIVENIKSKLFSHTDNKEASTAKTINSLAEESEEEKGIMKLSYS